jgi:hypothetical protein
MLAILLDKGSLTKGQHHDRPDLMAEPVGTGRWPNAWLLVPSLNSSQSYE